MLYYNFENLKLNCIFNSSLYLKGRGKLHSHKNCCVDLPTTNDRYVNEKKKNLFSWSHRMVWVGRYLKDHLVPTPSCHGQGHLPPDQAAQSSIQPGLEHCQEGGSHSFSGQPVPVPHHHYSKKFLPSIQPKPILFQFKTIIPRPVTTGLSEKSSSFLLAPFTYRMAVLRNMVSCMQPPYLNFLALSEVEDKVTYDTIVNLLPVFKFSLFCDRLFHNGYFINSSSSTIHFVSSFIRNTSLPL